MHVVSKWCICKLGVGSKVRGHGANKVTAVRTNFGSESSKSKVDGRHNWGHQLLRDGGHLLWVCLSSESDHGIEFDAEHWELQQLRRQQWRDHLRAKNTDVHSFDGVTRVV